MSSSFVDTNIVIAYVFLLEPKNKIAEYILTQEYDNIYCSDNVFNEFNDRSFEKKENLLSFYENFMLYLSDYNKKYISKKHMEEYAENLDFSDEKEYNDVLESISLFWKKYSPNSSSIPVVLMVEYINQLRNELEFGVFDRIDFCENLMINIDDNVHSRVNHYKNPGDLFEKLYSCGMHKKDIEISLDAYDFNLTLNHPLDFITFDKICYKCVLNENLSFNKVKCYEDYKNII